MPIFSIILPVYNGQNFLKETIESVVTQSFQDWELILVNDGSTDLTESIGLEYASQDARIKLISQSNEGLSSARNTGLAHCQGELIGFLDADDLFLPSCLEVIRSKFDSLEADFLVAGYFYFKENLTLHHHRFQESRVDFPSLITSNLAPPVAHFLKKEWVSQIGFFDTTLRSCEDWDFWIRAGKLGAKIHSISEVLVGYRYVPDSMSRNPLVMYEALSEVSRRAGQPDIRLPKEAPFNQVVELDYPSIQKKHLIRMVGVRLHQGKVHQAAEWYLKEKERWSWEEADTDWKGLATYLSWGYFFEPHQIDKLLTETTLDLSAFFELLGYSKPKIQLLLRLIFEPQLKRRNHQKYGKLVGGVKNKLGWY